jgi:hypothetical protein
MAGAPIITNLPIERPDESGSHFTEPWLEPFLVKHSSWYRRHMTKAGRRESKSKSSRNSSTITTYTEGGDRKAIVDEDEQWRRVEEEYAGTSQEHKKERRVVEV